MGLELEAWAIGIIMGSVTTAKILAANPKWLEIINEATKPKEKQKKDSLVKTVGKLEGKAAPLPESKMPDTSKLDKEIGKSL